jgi:hypothetical protein
VGFAPNEHYLEMADGAQGEREPRHFDHTREKRYFPAWNSAQTRVLFIGTDGKLMIMNSNGTNKRPFEPGDVDGKTWRSESMMPFTLKFKDTGDRYRIWRSKPDGSGESLVYETFARFISAPQWSPDSSRVAFIIDDGESSSILTVGADGSWPRRFFTTPDGLSELKWSPNSQRLAWLCERHAEGSSEVWTAGVEGLDPGPAPDQAGHQQRPHDRPGREEGPLHDPLRPHGPPAGLLAAGRGPGLLHGPAALAPRAPARTQLGPGDLPVVLAPYGLLFPRSFCGLSQNSARLGGRCAF